MKSVSDKTAPSRLNEDMWSAESLLTDIARECAVPAGHALAVGRTTFASRVTEAISSEPLIRIRREEVTHINEDELTIIASGPLTSDALAAQIARLCEPSEPRDDTRAGVPAPHRL